MVGDSGGGNGIAATGPTVVTRGVGAGTGFVGIAVTTGAAPFIGAEEGVGGAPAGEDGGIDVPDALDVMVASVGMLLVMPLLGDAMTPEGVIIATATMLPRAVVITGVGADIVAIDAAARAVGRETSGGAVMRESPP